jgi:hypothetical protein
VAQSNYEKYLVRKPLREAGPKAKNRQYPTMTYMSSTQVPEANCYAELGWIYGIPEPNPPIYEHSHNFDEIVFHIGGDPHNPEDLGAEIEYYVGGQPLVFDTTTALFVPKGVKHGPLTWKKFRKPHIEMGLILGGGTLDEGWGDSGFYTPKESPPQKTEDIDYEKYLVRKPIREVGAPPLPQVKGRTTPSMTYMSNDLVPGCNRYVKFGWIYDVPDPNPYVLEHSHEKYNELVLHIGGDPDNPEDLGAEIEFYVGGEPLFFDTTTALFVPKGVKHGPLTWKKVTGPHLQMAIILGAGTMSEAVPGGYKNE